MMRNYLKKHLPILLVLALFVSVICMNTQPVMAAQERAAAPYYGRSALADLPNATALLYAYDKLAAGVETAQASITVYDGSHAISQEEFAVVMDAYIRDYAHHFWLGNGYSMTLDDKTIHTVSPQYLMTGAALDKAKTAFEKEAQKLIDAAQKLSSDYEKELYLHDQLAARVTYVEATNAHNAYGALVEGKAVCEGYAEALQYLLQRCGIQSFIALGASANPNGGGKENHAWNYVRIDGKFYHVDLTWDDQGEDLFHAYFNVTDSVISQDHEIWGAEYALPQCNSQNAFYFKGKPEYLKTYSVDTVAELLKNNNLKAHVYVDGDPEDLWNWYETNIRSIAQKMGVSGSFSYGYSSLGHECILIFKGEVHTHVYDQRVTNSKYLAGEADCLKAATYYFSCSCGEKGSETFTSGSAKGHDYADATCTAPKTCKTCGATDGQKLGHSFTNYVPNGDATCGKDGTKTAKCDRCTEKDTVADTGSAKEHDYADATCTAPKTCKQCGATDGQKLGHSFTNYVSNNDATCGKDGTKTAKCDRCTEKDTVADTGSAKEHDYADATCTAPKTCKTCGATDGQKLGHSFTNYISNENASCEKDGTKTATCDHCGVKDTVTDTGSAKGHDYTEATCTAPQICKRCNQQGAPAADHAYETTWSVNDEGHWYACKNCTQKTQFAAHDFEQGDSCVVCQYARAHTHSLTLVAAVEATCTESGNQAYYTCSGCANWFADASGAQVIQDKNSVLIAALEHNFENYASNNDATCEADGTKTAKCSRCDQTHTLPDAGSAYGHDYSDLSCTSAKICKRCGENAGDALGHSFTNYVSNENATCTQDGTKTAKCDRCDAEDTVVDKGSASGHQYTQATCTEGAICTVCQANGLPALGHDYDECWISGSEGHWHGCVTCGERETVLPHEYEADADACVVCGYLRTHVHQLTLVVGVEASCVKTGRLPYYTCNGCEDWFEDTEGTLLITDKNALIVPALEHELSEATCTQAAKCQRPGCNYTEGEPLPHTPSEAWESDETGHWKLCECGEKLQQTAHVPGPEATETAPQTCMQCGYVLQQIQAHIHSLIKVEAKAATCDAPGNLEYYICPCGQWFADVQAATEITDHSSVQIPAGHNDADQNGVCDACGHKEPQPTSPNQGVEEPKNDMTVMIIIAAVVGVGIIGAAVVIILKTKRS